jgi:hypothetical protein
MTDVVARVLDLFRQSAEVGVTGVPHVTKSKVTARSSTVYAGYASYVPQSKSAGRIRS